MKNKRKNITKFIDIDMPLGVEIKFVNDKTIKAYVAENNHVLFDNKKDSLSDITTILLQERYGMSEKSRVNGFQFWLYQDELLSNRRTRLEKEALIKELQKLHKKD